MAWVFKNAAGQKLRNPLGDAFFTDTELLTDASSLIREAIQNSLDASGASDEPVRIRIKIGRQTDADVISDSFNGLEPHTEKVLGQAGQIKNSFRYLVYEDFNTTGLWGDTRIDQVPEGSLKEDHSYSFFAHYEGEGSKDDGKKGKWGVGKVVFPMLSQLKTFFSYSVRPKSKAPCGKTNILIGQSILKFHELGETFFQPDGWFAEAESESGVPLPLAGAIANRFAKQWSISRSEDQNGLSVVIPYIRKELGVPQFRDAVIRQYFLSILAQELECEFEDEAGTILVLNSKNISQVIDGLQNLTEGANRDLNTYQVRMAISSFVKAVKLEDPHLKFSVPDEVTPPSRMELSEELVSSASESLESKGVAVFEVTLDVPKAHSPGTESDSFEVLVVKAEGVNPIIYSREGILVPGTRAVKVRDFLVVVMMDQGPLANLLGASEGPAHEDWRDDTKRFKDYFGHSAQAQAKASRIIRVVRMLPSRIVDELTKFDDGVSDTEYFSDWFALTERPEESSKDTQGVAVKPNPPARNPAQPQLTFSVAGGVLSARGGSAKTPQGSTITLTLAHSVARGNAFSKWSALDFELGDKKSIRINSKGLKVQKYAGQEISFQVIAADSWLLEIAGFKEYRDIEVKSVIQDPPNEKA